VDGIHYKKECFNLDAIKDEIKNFFNKTAVKIGFESIPKHLQVTLLGALVGATAALAGIGIVSLIGSAAYCGTLGAGTVGTVAVAIRSPCSIGDSQSESKKSPDSKAENTKRVQQMALVRDFFQELLIHSLNIFMYHLHFHYDHNFSKF
jgi:hypothetical protein